MKIGETLWPSERVCVLLTPGGGIAYENGMPLFFTDQGKALEYLRPGYSLAAVDVFRVNVFATMEPKA